MKHTNIKPYSLMSILVIFLSSISIGITAEPKSKLLVDFSDASVAKQWLSVNDNVMGGISKGGFRITEDKTLEFSGNISLENRGGFASIRTRQIDSKLNGYNTIALRVKGDGRTYYLDLRSSSRNTAGSYRAPIKTQNNSWQEIRIPLKDFKYAAFGRRVPFVDSLSANNVQSVGFTLADKQAGPFRLEVSWIKGEKDTATNESQTVKRPDASAENKDIVDIAVAAGQFKTLVAAVKAAGLVEALKGKGPLTVFAPNDEAFAKLPESTLEDLLQPENRDKLSAILTYHVVPGKIFLGTQSPATLQGQSVTIKTAGSFEINGANMIATDIVASNGVIHVIDSVLIPTPKKLAPREAARAVIELAIKRGVPLFNEGQPSACAAIYEVAIESLLKSHTKAMGKEDRSVLQDALRQMRSNDENPRQQAWTLRRALDTIYESLTED